MTVSSVGNIVAITAYFFLTLLFFWVGTIPKANRSTFWWGAATTCILLARLNLLVAPGFISANYVEAIYAILIVIEKYFLIIGFMRFFLLESLGGFSRAVPMVICAELAIIILTKIAFLDATVFAVQFAFFNAAALIFVAMFISRHRADYMQRWRGFLMVVLGVFTLHWATYPIARNFDAWLQFGLIFGSFINLLLYLSVAMIALARFQQRLLDAEREAIENSQRAIQSNKAKSEFLANMSHEIRTPMNGVLGMLDVLKKSELNPQQVRQVNIALSSSRTLLSLINDILDFSKIEAGKLNIEAREFDVVDTLNDVGVFLHQLAAEKDIELVVNTLGVEQPRVVGDSERLRQIIVNLAGNAIKFTEKGCVALHAITTLGPDGKVMFTCDVVDTGIGIEEEKQDVLFKAFSQADTSTTRKYGGTGLGLTICKRLCEQMGGSISLRSRLGEGSCFSFSLTFGPAATDLTGVVEPSLDLSQHHVLVVDDNVTNLELLGDVFALWSNTPVMARSGKEAIAQVESQAQMFGLALVDMQMPEMDGEQLIVHLQTMPQCANTRFLILSSMSDEVLMARMLANGADAFLLKPLICKDLEDAIKRALGMLAAESERESDAPEVEVPAHVPHQIDELTSDAPKALRILLVEDNDINQYIAETLLEDNGLSCDIAEHGEIALALLKAADAERPYHLVLMDCQMPVMDGYLCTQSIRKGDAGDRYRDIPIIAMTANAMQGDREKCVAAGMNDYLAKPIEGAEFTRVLAQWINVVSRP